MHIFVYPSTAAAIFNLVRGPLYSPHYTTLTLTGGYMRSSRLSPFKTLSWNHLKLAESRNTIVVKCFGFSRNRTGIDTWMACKISERINEERGAIGRGKSVVQSVHTVAISSSLHLQDRKSHDLTIKTTDSHGGIKRQLIFESKRVNLQCLRCCGFTSCDPKTLIGQKLLLDLFSSE